MNRKQLMILLALAAVAGVAGWIVYQKGNRTGGTGDSALGKKLLDDLPVNDVARVLIRQGTNEVTLEKKEGEWRVRERQDYPANYPELSGFLLKARDLKIVQSEQVGPSQLPRLELASGQGTNSAVMLELDDQNGKAIRTLWLGKKHLKKSGQPSGEGDESFPDGRWVKVGDSMTVALISDPLDSIEPKPVSWLNKDFVRIEKARMIEAVYPAATNSWKLTRETESGEWKLSGAKPGEELDPAKTGGFADPMSSPTFTDVMSGAKLDGAGTNRPVTLKIVTFENFDYTLQVGAKTNDDFPVTVTVAAQLLKERAAGKNEKPEDKARLDKEFKDQQQKLEDKLKQEQAMVGWTYQVPGWVMEPLLKERGQLLVEKAAAGTTNAVSNVELPK